MARFPQHIVPVIGANLMAKLYATAQPLEYISVEVGDGRLGSWQPTGLTGLISSRLSLPIAATPVRLQDGRWNIKAVMSNRHLTAPMQWREWGIFATDPDTGNKVMVGYSNAGDAADPVYPWDGTPESLVEYSITCACFLTSEVEVTVVMDPTQVYVLKQEFDDHTHTAADVGADAAGSAATAEAEAKAYAAAEDVKVMTQLGNLATVVDTLADSVASIADSLCTLEITCAPPLQGKTITVTKGATVLSQTVGATLKVTYQLPELGTWSIYNPSTQKTDIIKADYYGNYYFVANVYRVMTVNIDLDNSNPATCCTYADDAIGMVAGSDAWDDFFGHYPVLFKNGVEVGKLKRTDFTKFEDGTPADITSGNAGDVMIAFPRRGLSIETVGSILTIKMTDNSNDTDFRYYAHERGTVSVDAFYIGAYRGFNLSGKLRSLSGKLPTGNQYIGNFRTQAQANGVGYELSGFYQATFRIAMYCLKYRHTNSQIAVGRGYVDGNPSVTITGGTNTKGMDWGEQTGKFQMKLFGVEDFWGNCYTYIDGVVSDVSFNILTATDGFNDTGNGYINRGRGATSKLIGFIAKVQGSTETGLIAKEIGGSETTYFCDQSILNASCVCMHGGAWTEAGRTGAFAFNMNGKYNANIDPAFGGQLMYLRKE